MLDKIIVFIDERRHENQGKFSKEDHFREFLFKDLQREFGDGTKKKEPAQVIINIEKRIEKPVDKKVSKQMAGRIRNQENAKKYLEKNGLSKTEGSDDSGMVDVKGAMEILGTKNRRDVDIPSSKGEIKKVGKRGVHIMFDKQSVIDYAEKRKHGNKEESHIIAHGPGGTVRIPANDPNKILGDEEDYEDDDE